MSCLCFSFPTITSCCYLCESIKTKCSSTDSNILNIRQLVRCMGEFSQLLKQWIGREMHYGRIYIQYFALWSSHWPGGLLVCVFVCVTTILRSTPLHFVNASAQWDQCNNVKGCQITLAVQKVPFLQMTADLRRDQCIDDLLKDYSDKQQRTQKFQVT